MYPLKETAFENASLFTATNTRSIFNYTKLNVVVKPGNLIHIQYRSGRLHSNRSVPSLALKLKPVLSCVFLSFLPPLKEMGCCGCCSLLPAFLKESAFSFHSIRSQKLLPAFTEESACSSHSARYQKARRTQSTAVAATDHHLPSQD